MAERKKKRPSTGKGTGPARADAVEGGVGRGLGADRSLGKILASRSADKIVPEISQRLEGGRQRLVKASVAASAAELDLLDAEARRIEKEGDPVGRKAARMARFRTTAAADGERARAIAEAIEKMVTPERGGWTVMGRVLDRNGVPPKQAEVILVDEQGAPVKGLAPIPVDSDGMARGSFPRSAIAALADKGVRVSAAVRIGRRIVATDTARGTIRGGRLHQFDLRIE